MKVKFSQTNKKPVFILDIDDFLLNTGDVRVKAFKCALRDNKEKYQKLGINDVEKLCSLIEPIKGRIKGSEFDTYLKKEDKGITKVLVDNFGFQPNKVKDEKGKERIAIKEEGSVFSYDFSANEILAELYKDAKIAQEEWLKILALNTTPFDKNNAPVYEFMPGAFEFLCSLYENDADVIVWSFGYGQNQEIIWKTLIDTWADNEKIDKSIKEKMLSQKIFGRSSLDNPDEKTEKPNLPKLQKAAEESGITIDLDTKIFFGDDSARTAKAIISLCQMLHGVPKDLLFALTAPLHANQDLLLDDNPELVEIKKLLHRSITSDDYVKGNIAGEALIASFVKEAKQLSADYSDTELNELAIYELANFQKMNLDFAKQLEKALKNTPEIDIGDLEQFMADHVIFADPYLTGLNDGVFSQEQVAEFFNIEVEESKSSDEFDGSVHLIV